MENLKTKLRDLAMSMTQDEYLEFVYQPLMQANGEKLRADIEQIKRERPDIVKAGEENTERILSYMQKDYDEYVERLKAEVKRLEEELKESGADKMKFPPPTPMPAYDSCMQFRCGAFEKPKSNRCKGCMFLDTYRDMGMSCDICSLIHSLDKATEATKCKEPCPNKLTMREACEYVERRNRLRNKNI